MKAIQLACFLVLSRIAVCDAAFTDFSDYTRRTEFAPNEVFESNGLLFQAVQLWPIENPVLIVSKPNYSALHPGPGVAFLLRPGIQEISFNYIDGASSALAVNGVMLRPYPSRAGFGYLHGASVGGVSISTTVDYDDISAEHGTLHLRGPIDRLLISGLELAIDDVLVQVPEPGAAALATLAAAALAVARRRIPPRP